MSQQLRKRQTATLNETSMKNYPSVKSSDLCSEEKDCFSPITSRGDIIYSVRNRRTQEGNYIQKERMPAALKTQR